MEGDRRGGYGGRCRLPCIEMGRVTGRSQCKGDYLHSGSIQTSGVCIYSPRFPPFPKAKRSDELLLLQMGQHWSHAPTTGYPHSVISSRMIWGRASTAARTDPTPSTASAKPAPRFVCLQTWVRPGWRCGKAKQCHELCKATRNMGAGHGLPAKAGFCSSDQVFHSKTKQAVPPGCFLQPPHFALLLGSHPTNQNHLEAETPPPSLPGVPATGFSASPPAWRVPEGRGATSPMESHASGACCSRPGCCWGNGFA